jgi:hypothetical protein
MCVLAAILLLAFLLGMPDARINQSRQAGRATLIDERVDFGNAAFVPDSFFNDLHIGALWFPAISNKGYIGFYDISAYYPGGGNQSSVWQSGVWAGGYVQGRDNAWIFYGSDGINSDMALYDDVDEQAVVETEDDLGLPYPYRRLTVHANTALKPYIISESDTLDGDTGLDVTWEWHQWGVTGYDHWVFLHATVTFNKDIDAFYWGWMSDCDIGDVNIPSYYYDDYVGWDETYKFCFMRDWDYDPLEGQPPAPSTEDSLFLSPNVVGQYLLAAPPVGGPITAAPDGAQKWTTKNYWDWSDDVSSIQDIYDRTSGTWINPFPSPTPFDYRILNAVGPYDVSAGDTAHIWMAYVLGEGYNEESHSQYGMGTLVDHVQAAQAFYNSGMVVPAGAYPPRAPDLAPDFENDVIDDQLTVHWDPYVDIPGGATADSFIVYRSTISKLGPWERIVAFDNSVTETIIDLVSGCNYVWVQAFDTSNESGSNPWALTSRLYKPDADGIIRANHNTIVCVQVAPTGDTPALASRLYQNYPNPFNPVTTIRFNLKQAANVNLCIYNVRGELIADLVNGYMTEGSKEVNWTAKDYMGRKVASGIYFYRLVAGDFVQTRKMVLLR